LIYNELCLSEAPFLLAFDNKVLPHSLFFQWPDSPRATATSVTPRFRGGAMVANMHGDSMQATAQQN